MTPVEMVYLASLLLGGGYLTFASVMHMIGGAGGDHDAPDVDMDVGDLDGDIDGGDLDAAAGDHDVQTAHGVSDHGHAAESDSLGHVSFLSPLVLSTLLVGFGAMGFTVQHWLTELVIISMAAAVGMAAIGGGGVWWSLNKLRAVEGGSETKVLSLLGHTAVVSVGVPAKGLGEIVYEQNNSRFNAPARSRDGREIPRGARVIIGGFDGVIFLVEEAQHSRIRRLAEARPADDAGDGGADATQARSTPEQDGGGGGRAL